MLRQYAASSLFGILLKLSDDVQDIETFKPYISDTIFEIIKGLIYVTYTYMAINNINIIFIILIGHLLLQIKDEKCINNPFFLGGIVISILLCIFLFSSEKFDMLFILINIILIFIPAFIDHKFFPEDYSIKKIIGRFYESLSVFICLIFLFFYPQNYIIKETLFFGMFYTITSVITMSTQYTKDQINKSQIINIIKYFVNFFKEEANNKINIIIEKINEIENNIIEDDKHIEVIAKPEENKPIEPVVETKQ